MNNTTTIAYKNCFKCCVEKPITDFYKHKKMGDGHLNKCKSCTKKDVDVRYKELIKDPVYLELERSRGRNKYHRLYIGKKISPEVRKEATKKYRTNYPEKYKAVSMCQAIRKRVKGIELHHWSYKIAHALDVIQINKKDHATIHRFLKYDKEHFQYRTLQCELLDTKEKHLNYINTILKQLN